MTPLEGPERPPTRPASNPNSTPRVELSEAISAVDLVQLVTRYSGPGRLSGGVWTFSCPHPDHTDHHPSFTVSRDRSGRWRWKCWSQCDTSGDAMDLLRWLDGISGSEARSRILTMTGLGISHEYLPSRRSSEPAPITPPIPAGEGEEILGVYLRWRGWPRSVLERFHLEAVSDGRSGIRIRHPFLRPEADGTLSVPYWQDRARKGITPKWKSPARARPLPHNLPSLQSDTLRAVLITEGPADAISASVALGEDRSIAVLGIPGVGVWRRSWALALAGLPVAIWRDSDPAGASLVEAVRASLDRNLSVISTDHPDLSDALRADGTDAVRDRILEAFTDAPEATTEDPLAVALEIFPGSRVFDSSEVNRDR